MSLASNPTVEYEDAGEQPAASDSSDLRDRVIAEIARHDVAAAMRTEILLAIEAAGLSVRTLQTMWLERGSDLADVRSLLPAGDFYARHRVALEGRVARELVQSGHRDLAAYMASWRGNRPGSASRHDAERAVVEHVVATIVFEVSDVQREFRSAQLAYGQARARILMRQRQRIPLSAVTSYRPDR